LRNELFFSINDAYFCRRGQTRGLWVLLGFVDKVGYLKFRKLVFFAPLSFFGPRFGGHDLGLWVPCVG
jgi:hypothetical protein